MSPTASPAAPPHTIDPADWLQADTVNRLNQAFDHFDLETMVAVFTDHCVVEHPHGRVEGHDQLRAFYAAYRPFTVGVRRHNTNHVVDAAADGSLTVTTQNLLVRIATVAAARPIGQRDVDVSGTGLPGVFVHATTTDRFRRTPHGWRIAHRIVEDTTANDSLRPGATDMSVAARCASRDSRIVLDDRSMLGADVAITRVTGVRRRSRCGWGAVFSEGVASSWTVVGSARRSTSDRKPARVSSSCKRLIGGVGHHDHRRVTAPGAECHCRVEQ